MKADIALSAHKISKAYRLGSFQQNNLSPWGTINRAIFAPYYRYKELARLSKISEDNEPDLLWALKDVSFEVKKGEILGFMGANGAGKSTLLKIISRIVTPTSGHIHYQGLLASLLEVGTGFNGELTGRENIYLNGSMLGLKRDQINEIFDEIVDFSGVSRFIDTPIKKYSSGMTIRLAFSVAVHLNADILILDEVLSVGDAQFSAKSIEKMEKVAKDGKTVLFVSHSTAAVTRLCDRAIFLTEGRMTMEGSVEEVTGVYLGKVSHARTNVDWALDSAPRAEGILKVLSVRLVDKGRRPLDKIHEGSFLGIELSFEVLSDQHQIVANVQIVTELETVLFTSAENHSESRMSSRPKGLTTVTCWLKPNLLVAGTYSVNIFFRGKDPEDIYLEEKSLLTFELNKDPNKNEFGLEFEAGPGLIHPQCDWQKETA